MSMVLDLRSFLDDLREHHPGAVLDVDLDGKAFSLVECDAGAFLTQLRSAGRRPVLVMRGLKAHSGRPWEGRVLFSELVTHETQCAALGLPAATTYRAWAEEWLRRSSAPLDPVRVSPADAPVKRHVFAADRMTLHDLPIYRKDEFDARPGWLCAIAVARACDSPRYNLSWHRMHVRAADWAAARVNPRHLNEYMRGYRAAGHRMMPVAFLLGHHPAFEMAAAASCDWQTDEYRFAGGIMGTPVRLVPSETFGEELLVPADAELVVEGYLDLERRELCGPWADFMRYYSPQTLEPVFQPTAFSWRDDAICVHNWTSRENLGTYHSSSQMFAALKRRFPGVLAVSRLAPFTYAVQFKATRAGEAARLGAYFLGSFADHVKNVVLVDEDIDPADPAAVFFSIATRVDAETSQVQVLRGLLANRHDPATQRDGLIGGLVIDSTKPVGKPFPPLGKAPGDAMDRIRWEELV